MEYFRTAQEIGFSWKTFRLLSSENRTVSGWSYFFSIKKFGNFK